jgi:UDP-N-acetylglucosamine--N-acetylmuramyl-(pentapeptide) pyrophosphoryl-undecaprenol N-acetylglucosamine transferase
MEPRVMVMAGGTGGHVFPALAVADWLRGQGCEILWLGTPGGMESRLVPDHGYALQTIQIQGLRGTGLKRRLAAPFVLLRALWQAMTVLRSYRPQLVLGMGGFVTGPGGLMARLLRIPLVIQEQNAIPGLTNRLLSHIAQRVFEAFPGSFNKARSAVASGNPVRQEIISLPIPEQRFAAHGERPRLLVLGGSLGAKALNEMVPAALARLAPAQRPLVRHQAGERTCQEALDAYAKAGVEAEVKAFEKDMAGAYGWADLVICRAGALTVSELAAAGLGSILVPFPFAVDDHQTRNAAYLVDAGAAFCIQQSALTAEGLAQLLEDLLSAPGRLLEMANSARALARPQAVEQIGRACLEVMQP